MNTLTAPMGLAQFHSTKIEQPRKWLIDPTDIINYNRTEEELQLFWLFCGVVAGKTAKVQALKLERFLESLPGRTPFLKIHGTNRWTLLRALQDVKLGQYTRLHSFMSSSLWLPSLKKVGLSGLEAVSGVGPKTARMFLMFTRPNQRIAALDTHVLKWLADHGHKVPKNTPPAGRTYDRLEDAFLELADKAGMPVADYDLMVWRHYAT